MKKDKLFGIAIFIVITALIFLPLFFKDYLQEFQTLGIVGLFFINFFGSATIFLPAPAILSIPIFATVYNPILVAIVAALGSSLGESTAFFLGKTSKHIIKKQKKNKTFSSLHLLFKQYGALLIFIAAIIPNPFIDGLGIIAGFSSYPLQKFLLFTFCGRLIRNMLLTLFPQAYQHLK